MSLPETNALSPAPRKMTTRISGLLARESQILLSSSYIGQVSALRAAGLLKVTHATFPSICRSKQGGVELVVMSPF